MATALLTWPDKGPDEDLDYELDWSDWLANGDVVASSVWVIPADLTSHDQSNTTTSTLTWLSGGVVGKAYPCLNKIVTNGGRKPERTVYINCISK